MKKVIKYFSKNVFYNSFLHALAGIGLGIIIARPLVGNHPVRWGVAFIVIALLGHLWAYIQK